MGGFNLKDQGFVRSYGVLDGFAGICRSLISALRLHSFLRGVCFCEQHTVP